MANWLPSSRPPWWGTVKRFAQNPTAFVISAVSVWILGRLLGFVEAGLEAILGIFNPLIGIPGFVATEIARAFAPLAEVGFWAVGTAVGILDALNASLGPFAPFVIVPGAAVLALIAYEVTKRIAEIPLRYIGVIR